MATLSKLLRSLIENAKVLGLEQNDAINASSFIEYNEFGLAFDTVITQLYEYDRDINEDFYKLISAIGNKMNIPENEYIPMKELIRNETSIPKPVRDELAKLIKSIHKT